jgi:seryl-tRNA synthetase
LAEFFKRRNSDQTYAVTPKGFELKIVWFLLTFGYSVLVGSNLGYILLKSWPEKEKKAVAERNADRESQVQEAAQRWLSMLEGLAEQIQKQQQNSQQMIQELMNTYMQLLNIPSSYISEQTQEQHQAFQQTVQQWMEQAQEQHQTFQQQAQQQQQTFQQMAQEAMNAYMQLFNIPVSYAQESARIAQERTDQPQG